MTSRSWHMADIWEIVADAVPDRAAVIYENKILSWRDYENRAARLARVFVDHGLQPGDAVAIYSHNRPEYLIAQFAAFKARLSPININYRYLEDELVHVIDNSDSVCVVFEAEFAPRLKAIRDRLPNMSLWLEVGDAPTLEGALGFDKAWRNAEPMPRTQRSDEDRYMLYTGGTTGLPKGVVYSHEGFVRTLIGGALAMRGIEPPARPEALADIARGLASADASPVCLPAPPIMHGAGMWIGVVAPHSFGGTVVLHDNRSFDADHLLSVISRHSVRDIVIIGDVFARPLVAALDTAAARGQPYDLSALQRVTSSGVMFSAEVKRALLVHVDAVILDSMGGTEGGIGASVSTRDSVASDRTARFRLNSTSRVLREDGTPIAPGSEEVGLLCNGGMIPIEYYKDPAKSAETFRTIDGVRYSVSGDYASLEADGTITLLGRGSTCINTGGEKVFPEEVEEALKSHISIKDCLVVGVPDERFGHAVTAVYSAGDDVPTDAALKAHIRERLADYKAPKRYVRVDTVPRAANGKADYTTARALALAAL